ncbi:MAG: ABC transporter ATP-binding protein [candidate division Zixibacteria bacterium]|nr:ABC transporter ATP-binding protein [candidate division Zixibacteria bacterium]
MIKLEEFSKKYGSFQAVYPTGFEVGDGQTYALLGPNGSGKTTIFKAMVGLSRPTTGKVLIDNSDLWQKPEKVKAKLSFLPQRITIPENLKVWEALDFFTRLKQAPSGRLEEVLAYIELMSDINQYVGKLSGGMLQRLGLVITFLADTSVYILDEPTLNLDLQGMKSFRRYLKYLKEQGKTIVFSSHALLDAESLSDRVGVLVDGRLVLDLTVTEFRAKVKNRSNIILVLADKNPGLVELAYRHGAQMAEFENGYFRYRADLVSQIKIIEAIRRNGDEIINISTEKPDLDQIIREDDV